MLQRRATSAAMRVINKKNFFNPVEIKQLIASAQALRQDLASHHLNQPADENPVTPEEIDCQVAMQVMRFGHQNQKRVNGGPYDQHPLEVGNLQNNWVDRQIGYLHDVCEDTNITPEHLLRMGFSTEVVENVSVLTKKKSTPYIDHIESIAPYPRARRIKITDMECNTRHDQVVIFSEPPKERRYLKEKCYQFTLPYLEAVENGQTNPNTSLGRFISETNLLSYIHSLPEVHTTDRTRTAIRPRDEEMDAIAGMFMTFSGNNEWIHDLQRAIYTLNLPVPPSYKNWFRPANPVQGLYLAVG